MDAGLMIALVMLDLSTVFETVDILRDQFGNVQHELQWFRSYHTGRSHTFKIPDNVAHLLGV